MHIVIYLSQSCCSVNHHVWYFTVCTLMHQLTINQLQHCKALCNDIMLMDQNKSDVECNAIKASSGSGLCAAGSSSAVSVHVCVYTLAVPPGQDGKLKVLTDGWERAI